MDRIINTLEFTLCTYHSRNYKNMFKMDNYEKSHSMVHAHTGPNHGPQVIYHKIQQDELQQHLKL